MVRIERGEVGFEEIEMNEQTMPGAAGWSLLARARRMTKLRGGVIADAIGGKSFAQCISSRGFLVLMLTYVSNISW